MLETLRQLMLKHACGALSYLGLSIPICMTNLVLAYPSPPVPTCQGVPSHTDYSQALICMVT